jgi:hypothetical protein
MEWKHALKIQILPRHDQHPFLPAQSDLIRGIAQRVRPGGACGGETAGRTRDPVARSEIEVQRPRDGTHDPQRVAAHPASIGHAVKMVAEEHGRAGARAKEAGLPVAQGRDAETALGERLLHTAGRIKSVWRQAPHKGSIKFISLRPRPGICIGGADVKSPYACDHLYRQRFVFQKGAGGKTVS